MAQEIKAEARRAAAQTVQVAQERAEQLVAKARKESGALQKGGEEALRIAMRDTVLHLKGQLMEQFNAEVRRLITVITSYSIHYTKLYDICTVSRYFEITWSLKTIVPNLDYGEFATHGLTLRMDTL